MRYGVDQRDRLTVLIVLLVKKDFKI